METTTNGKQTLTHSRLACFRACPRKHWIRYELGLRPVDSGAPQRVGTAFHEMLAAAERGQDIAAIKVDDLHEMALVAAMYGCHRDRWAGQKYETIFVEREFDLPLVNPATGSPTPIWRVGGKIDRVVIMPDNRVALFEYKTTSRDFSPGADYWMRLHLDPQLSMYVIAAREMGYPVETIIYDVTRRPALRPLKATPPEARKYTKAGQLYATQRDADETPGDYRLRVEQAMRDEPDRHFARIEIPRLDQDLDECREALWQQQLALRSAQLTNRWYRNPGACFEPMPCEYLSVCLNRDLAERTPEGYARGADVHPELVGDATSEG